ncbi:villin-1-like [Cimex lectularius]|uniref:HP domain-containing protein n=1 Tax=Cimex lectularius TaxID=79782 RepID=A0A8I6S1H8_CIMLE|nr:villin-1-like [Cimex lectularius]
MASSISVLSVVGETQECEYVLYLTLHYTGIGSLKHTDMKGTNKATSETSQNVDPAFRSICKASWAFLIWRVENLQLVSIPREQYGTFYDGDSYVVYAASEYGKHVGPNTKNKEIHGKMEMHIHFWLGQNTSQDESAVAAFKSVELDDYLGGTPVQHREVRGYESARFKAYFKDGIRVMIGGVETGLKTINNNVEARLFRVKGRRSPVLTQMPAVSWDYFNSGDVFIIDTKDVVFVWSGRTANSMEKLQAAKVATQFKDERNALSIVFVDDGKELELTVPEQTLLGFYLELSPLAKRNIPDHSGDDLQVEANIRSALKLYRCTDADGIYKVIEVKTGALEQNDLNPNDSYIIDNGPYHIWVWVGKHASAKERVEAMRNGHGFLKKKNYPVHCGITRVVDGGEPIEFKVIFTSWREDEIRPIIKTVNAGNSVKHVPIKLDAATLHNDPHLAAQEQLLDDGGGSLTVWKIRSTSLEEMPKTNWNVLYSAESYLIQYVYTFEDKTANILYHWKGEDKIETDKNSLGSLMMSQEVSLSKSTVQVRTYQGKEPPHLLAAFKGKLVVFKGAQKTSLPKTFLLQVKGNQIYNTSACQQLLKRSSLNSNCVFILGNEENVFIWCGKGSTGDEREMAKSVAKSISDGELVVLYEGLEKPDFWKILGTEGVYANVRSKKLSSKVTSTRLFHCSNASRTFTVEEIMNFHQSDLIQEDIMVLDAFHTLFIWVGNLANKEEKIKAVDFAYEYLETDPCKRSSEVTIIQINQGHEPPIFTGFFTTWDSKFWTTNKTFEDLRRELDEQKPALHVDLIVAESLPNFYDCDKYPVEVLLEKDPEKLPPGVDFQHKEIYLSPEDFYCTFNMKYQQFTELPKWKQDSHKKNVGLF